MMIDSLMVEKQALLSQKMAIQLEFDKERKKSEWMTQEQIILKSKMQGMYDDMATFQAEIEGLKQRVCLYSLRLIKGKQDDKTIEHLTTKLESMHSQHATITVRTPP